MEAFAYTENEPSQIFEDGRALSRHSCRWYRSENFRRNDLGLGKGFTISADFEISL